MTFVNLKNSAPIEVFGDIGGGGSSKEIIVVHANYDPETHIETLDKTYKEIFDAVMAGKCVMYLNSEENDTSRVLKWEYMTNNGFSDHGPDWNRDPNIPARYYLASSWNGSTYYNAMTMDDYPFREVND